MSLAAFGLIASLRGAMSTRRGRLVALIILAVASLGTYTAFIWNGGRNAVIEEVEKQNDKAGDAADAAELDFLRCADLGGVFQFDTGECRGLGQGGR